MRTTPHRCVDAPHDAVRVPRDRGFTLVEIVVAIVIVGILSAVVVMGVGRLSSQGEDAACLASLDAARAASTAHFATTGAYPTTFDELVSSGSLTLPDDAQIEPGGVTLTAPAWGLQLIGGTPPTFACNDSLPVAGPVAQFDASNAAAIDVAEFCSVQTRWADRSGNGFDLTSYPAAGGITWSASALNGRPAVTTSGLSVLRNTVLTMSAGSVFVVARMTGSGPTQRILSGWANNWLLGWWMGWQDAAHFDAWLNGAPTPVTTDPLLYSATMQPGVSATAWRNGTAVRTTTSGSATSTPAGLVVGGAHVNTSEYSAAAVSEVIVYDRVLPDAERQQTERYLADKWGITVSGTATAAMAPAPKAWFDATASDDLIASTEVCAPSVTAWRSSVGSRVLVPRNGVAAAQIDPTGFLGQPAVRTNGTNNLIDGSLSLPGDASVFVVSAPVGVTQRVLSSTGNNWLLGWWGTRENVAYFEGWAASWSAPAAVTASGPHLYSTVIDRGVRADVFGDGVPLASSTSATATPLGLSVGGWGSSEFTEAAVAEVIVYDRVLTEQERRSVESYLAAKWGLTLG